MKEISVFGEQAREIEEGQVFIARKDSIEGRDIVILEPKINIDKDGCVSYEVKNES